MLKGDQVAGAKNATVDATLPSPPANLDYRLGRPTPTVPRSIRDREVAEALWPLLLSGAPLVALTGKTAVDLGLDSVTASARVRQLLGELNRLRLLSP